MLNFQSCAAYSFGNNLNNKKDVLLVFPGKYRAPDPQMPLALLYLASALGQEGFSVRILDMRIDDYHYFKLGNPIFVGVSCMSGIQIKYALEFARYMRKQNSEVPLVWGGVHPTLLPKQTIQSDMVDVVVRGEGDLTVKDLANALAQGQPLDEIAGITFKVNDTIKSNPEGKLVNLDEIPLALPYNLLQIGQYPSFRAGRFHIQTSRGCPHRCGFCYNTNFNHNRWRAKSANRVLDEIQYIKTKYPHIRSIDPIDDNVFVDEYRVQQICQGLIERKLGVQWRANCRFDYLANYSQAFLELLAKSGCVELDFGGESGSERIQQRIGKDVTVEEMVQAVTNLHHFSPSIEPYISWMSGLPGETDEDLEQTFDLMDKMQEINPKTQHYGIFVYTPFPSPVMESLPEGFLAPQTLEEWSNVNVFHFDPPWHTKAQIRKLHTISAVTRIAFYPKARIGERRLGFRLTYNLVNRVAKYRWKHRNFSFPLELRLTDTVARYYKGFL